MDYSQTLNLPVTNFHIYSESEIIGLWRKSQINSQLRRKNKTSSNRYIIYGTPIPTDSVNWNSLRTHISKDIFFKYKNMTGADVHWIAIWDVYNPSIERNTLQKLGVEKRKYDTIRLRRLCRQQLEEDIRVQMELLESLGVFYDWEKIKKTVNPRTDARIITAFGELVENRYLRKDIRPSYWCVKCQTILSNEDDMTQKTYQAYSGYVKFPVSIGLEEYGEKVYMPVWVNTLWILAASVAIVIREGGIYSVVKSGDEVLIVEKGKESLLFDLNEIKILNYIEASKLAQCKCAHPFLEYDLPVVSSKYVKDRVGIGLYNVAPGHNPIDYELALKHKFKTFSVVDAEGRLTDGADKFCGLEFIEAGKFIALELEEHGYLMKSSSGGSEYPHCAYCGTPAIFRPVSQWLLSSKNNNLRLHTLNELEKIDWKCDSVIKRKIIDKIEKVTNWCISYQREWGIPIPIIQCSKCGQAIVNGEVRKSIKDVIYRRRPDSWFRLDAEKLLPSNTKCPNCDSQEFVKEQGVLNPNFSSIISMLTQIPAKNRSTHTTGVFWGNKQNWSQYLALFSLTSYALKNSIPFDKLRTYLFDESPEDILFLDILFNPDDLKNYNPDFIRLCAIAITERTEAAENNIENLSVQNNLTDGVERVISHRSEIQKQRDSLRKEYELMVKMLYMAVSNLPLSPLSGGNKGGDHHDKDAQKYSSLMDLDKIALVRLEKLIHDVTKAYDRCKFSAVWNLISEYFQVDFGFYLDAAKERLYASAQTSVERQSAQTVLWENVNTLTKLIAPIFPFLSEQIWSIFNHRVYESNSSDEFSSVFLTPFPVGVSTHNSESDLL